MEELTRWAKELEKKDGLGFEDAFRKVVKENPELYRQAAQAVKMESPTHYGKITEVKREFDSSGGGGNASARLARMATVKAKEDGVDYRTALSEVHRENPELAREYQRQIPRCDD